MRETGIVLKRTCITLECLVIIINSQHVHLRCGSRCFDVVVKLCSQGVRQVQGSDLASFASTLDIIDTLTLISEPSPRGEASLEVYNPEQLE